MAGQPGLRLGTLLLLIAEGLAGCDAERGVSSGTVGAAGVATSDSAGAAGAVEDESRELSWSDGYLENAELGLSGAVFAESDPYTAPGLTTNLGAPPEDVIASACIKGTAVRVDEASDACVTKMFTAPATDCFGEYWGAAIGMYLNQPRDLESSEKGQALPFDASALEGFSFELAGPTVPGPAALRFQIESADGRLFCASRGVKIAPGKNRILFEQLEEDCFLRPSDPPRPTLESVASELLKVSWRVVTNTTSEVPFDLCVSNIHALLK